MKTLRIICAFYTVFYFSLTTISCQEKMENYAFQSIYLELTHRPITSIFKDHEGYLWIATYGDGLFKHNSINYKNYKQVSNSKKTALNSSLILSTLQDSENKIWAGTNYGLNVYNPDLDRFETIPLIVDGKSENLKIHSIAEYNKETLLLGTHEKGLYKFDKKKQTIQEIAFNGKQSKINLQINDIVKSPNGRFLIGTNFGLMTFDPYVELLQLAVLATKNNKQQTIKSAIESMLLTSNHSIWLGTSKTGLIEVIEDETGIYTIDKFPISSNRVLCLVEKSNTSLLCGTENDGLFEIDFSTSTIKNLKYDKLGRSNLKSNSIWTIYTDDHERIWLGYHHNGIDVYDPNRSKFKSIKSTRYLQNSLSSNSVTGIISDNKDQLWISSHNGGLDVYDPKKNSFIHLLDQKNPIAKGLTRNDVQTIFIDSRNNIWIGTWDSGLFLLESNKKTFIHIHKNSPNSIFKTNRIMSFSEDSKGTIWIGTFLHGLYSYNTTKKSFNHYDSKEFKKNNINTSNIRKVLVDQKDHIWVGSRQGLYKIDTSKDSNFTITSLNNKFYKNSEKLKSSLHIISLFQDSNELIWIGTLSNGLFSYDSKKDSITSHNSTYGIPHETIASITQDKDNNLWLGGNYGLSKLDLKSKTSTNFRKKDGLLSNHFNNNSVLRSRSGILYFGGSKGINYFEPDNIVYNKQKPQVYLTKLKVSNATIVPGDKESPLDKVISRTKEITLKNNQSSFSLEYIGINYTRSRNNRYAYILEGYESKWNFVGSTKIATYKNIPSGNYTFKVKAANNDGKWNKTPIEISVKILPPWWMTNSAIVVYLLLFVLISFSIYKTITIRVKEKQTLTFEREQYRQFEALNAKKIQFFTNISHEFRTPLTLILTPLEDIIENDNSLVPENIIEKHNVIYKNAKRLSRLINELMDFRKLQFNKMSINASQINIVPFIEEVVSHFEEEAALKNIFLSLDYKQKEYTLWSDPSMLEKIIFNLLSNAFKATPADGSITIEINKPKRLALLPLVDEVKPVEVIEIVIKDTGIGIAKENQDKVFQRFYENNSNHENNKAGGGIGIGLELVKSFVDLHKGKIEIKSTLNVGTQFNLYFPLGYAHLNEENLKKNKKQAISEDAESLETTTIGKTDKNREKKEKKILLIVEDNLDLRTYLKNELKENYNIKEAANGLEGYEKATKYIPDIIITDVMMPIMDGFEFCERIKTDLKTSHIPLLMVTAKGMQIDKIKGIDSGADVYLNKPFNMTVLKSHLNQLISSRQILFDKYFNSINTSVLSENTTSLDKEFMTSVLSYINENIGDEKLNVEYLAGELLLSRSKLYRKIKALTGSTANEFIRTVRLERAKQIIEVSEDTISEVCYQVGFSSPSYFTKCFKDKYGFLPTEIRDNSK